jgi:multidrug transporter EmrE-like cation transporter
MAGISPSVVLMFLAAIAAQVVTVFLLPLSRGLTDIVPTVGMFLSSLVAIGLFSRIIHAGVNLGILLPLFGASVPLVAVILGFFYFGEAASLAKIATLVAACVLIGVANLLR